MGDSEPAIAADDGQPAAALPEPLHLVQLMLKVNYQVDKSSFPFHVHRLNELKQQGQISKVVLKKEDYLHSFFVTFCGPGIEGKSPPLPADGTSWSAGVSIGVDVPLIHDVLKSPLELCIFETVKVPVALSTDRAEKAKLNAGANLKFNLANTGLTNAQQRIKRAKKKKDEQNAVCQINGSNESQNDSTGARPASILQGPAKMPGSSYENDPLAIKALQGYGYTEDSRITTASTMKANNTRMNTAQGKGVTVIAKGERSRGIGSSMGSKPQRSSSKSRPSSQDLDQEKGRKESPHPHHFDHPERHTPSAGGLKRSRSALSLASLSQLTMRPKTPPQPHHFDHPISTLFPRKARSGSVGKEINRQDSIRSSHPTDEPYGLNTNSNNILRADRKDRILLKDG
ncbi:hypothetical protein HDU67_002925 [Dinochytrium kinnereticum]|nr:hypothetical protein HDU67_002925 [Dinochytrium kinnereticum]